MQFYDLDLGKLNSVGVAVKAVPQAIHSTRLMPTLITELSLYTE